VVALRHAGGTAKVALIAGVTKDLIDKIHAGKLIQALAKRVGVQAAEDLTWPKLAEKTQLA